MPKKKMKKRNNNNKDDKAQTCRNLETASLHPLREETGLTTANQ